MERSSCRGRRVVLQGVQRQVRGRDQGSGPHPGGDGQPADGSPSVGRGPVQSGTVGGDQKQFRSRPYRSRDSTPGIRFRGNRTCTVYTVVP